MEESYIDLHVHTTESDGTLTPAEVIDLAVQQNLCALALTDHETISGIDKAQTAAREQQIELIPGIEISTNYNGIELHILGFFITTTDTAFTKEIEQLIARRVDRNIKMTERLQAQGFPINLDQIQASYPGSIITRAHFARYLVEQGYVANRTIVFQKYLGTDCCCFVPRQKISPFHAMDIIRMGGGISCLAHPVLYPIGNTHLESLVKELKEHGLSALEAIYSMNALRDERRLIALAQKYDLAISGGSDFHGSNKPQIQLGTGKGNLRIPYHILTSLRQRLHADS
jgi:predicted metal-dependent phosphoesterase TrpH